MINRIEGKYDEWISVKDIPKDAEIDDSVQMLYVDTRDFAIGWNFEQPNYYENAECGYKCNTNNGLEKLRNLFSVSNRSKYMISKSEIISWLDDLCKKTGGHDEEWRCLEANLKNCMNWNLKYIRFVRNPKIPDEFVACNNYMYPIEWREVIKNIIHREY